MKTKLKTPYASHLRYALIANIILLSSGCGFFESYPGKEDFSQYLAPGCTLISVADFEQLPDDMGQKRIVFHYQADCVIEGSKTTTRVHASQPFHQYSEWGMKKWVAQERQYLPGPKTNMDTRITSNPKPSRALPYSDAPECNARVQRMVDEVLPCLEAQRPDLVQPLRDLIEKQKTQTRFYGQDPNRSEVLLQMEKQCEEYWHQVNRQLPTGNAPGACALKD